jgi:hypothetical protein
LSARWPSPVPTGVPRRRFPRAAWFARECHCAYVRWSERGQHSNHQRRYLVSGSTGPPRTIHGVGYNPYASLPTAQRSALYDRDFGEMDQLVINTIDAWFENQFDAVTLKAQPGLGLHGGPERPRGYPGATDRVLRALQGLPGCAHVGTRQRKPPSIFVRPLGQPDERPDCPRARKGIRRVPARGCRRIHAVDPNHSVLYRMRRTCTSRGLRARSPRPARPSLAGVRANVYSDARLQQVVGAWLNQWPGLRRWTPGLLARWSPITKVFGFVDPNGVPTNSRLAALVAAHTAETSVAGTQPNK